MSLRASLGACAVFLLGCASPGVAGAQQLELVVAASSPSPAGIAAKARDLAPRFKDGFIVQATDCGEARHVFAFVTAAEPSRDAAGAILIQTRQVVPDAYLKTCSVKPGSLLALRVSAVDASIGDVPADAVNWTDEDRVSSVRTLPGGHALLFVRYYEKQADDPLEGRRVRVVLWQSPGKTVVLDQNCTRPGTPAADGGRLAIACASEQAGDNLLHVVDVFDASGAKLKSVEHCRNPRWLAAKTLQCESESVGPGGDLKLEARRIEIP